jgi:hypothetical protein
LEALPAGNSVATVVRGPGAAEQGGLGLRARR